MLRLECEILDTWTKESRRFSVQPIQEEQVKCLAPADISIYCGRDGQAGFINVENGLEFTEVLKADSPDQEPRPIDWKKGPIDITGQEVLTIKSALHNEVLKVSLANGSESPGPDTPPRQQYHPRLP